MTKTIEIYRGRFTRSGRHVRLVFGRDASLGGIRHLSPETGTSGVSRAPRHRTKKPVQIFATGARAEAWRGVYMAQPCLVANGTTRQNCSTASVYPGHHGYAQKLQPMTAHGKARYSLESSWAQEGAQTASCANNALRPSHHRLQLCSRPPISPFVLVTACHNSDITINVGHEKQKKTVFVLTTATGTRCKPDNTRSRKSTHSCAYTVVEHHNSARLVKKLCRLDYSHVSPGTQKS